MGCRLGDEAVAYSIEVQGGAQLDRLVELEGSTETIDRGVWAGGWWLVKAEA